MNIGTGARMLACGAALALTFGLVSAGAAAADNGPSPGNHSGRDAHGAAGNPQGALFVSPSGSPAHAGGSCDDASFDSIVAAVAAAPGGGTVVVCPGTYAEDVVVGKALTLVGLDATIDATGLENAVQVVANDVSVRGFTLEHAQGEGLLVGADTPADGALLPPSSPVLDGVVVRDNTVVDNDRGFTGTENSNCAYPGDCGGGIHMQVTTRSVVSDNVVEGNADGILLTDDYGPSSANVIEGNTVDGNTHECGIVLASHNGGAVSFDQATFAETGRNPSVGGLYGNVIRDNVADRNGTDQAPPQFGGGGSGAGIGLFASGPGTGVYDNLVVGNEASGNGLAGYTMHAHLPGGEDINGNVVVHNTFGTNNVGGDGFDGPPTMDFQTTGIAIYSASPAKLVVAANRIHDDAIGIWLSKVLAVGGVASNHDTGVTTPVVTG